MSLIRKIAHNSAIQIVGKGISTLLGLAAVALMTRTLGTEQFGWYVTAVGFLQFVGILCDFGFTVTTSNLLSEPRFDKNDLMNNLFTWRLITAVIFNGLAPLVIYFFPYNSEIKWAALIVSVSFIFNTLNQVFIGYYREKLKAIVVTLAEVFGRITLVAGIALCVRGQFGFLPMMSIITLASIINTIYLWVNISNLRLQIDHVITKAIFSKMWPTAISVIFNAMYLQADRVILPLYVSAAEIGYYGAAYRVLDIVLQVAAIVMGLIMPLITYSWSRGNDVEFKKHYQMGFDLLSLVLMPMLVGIFVLARPIMEFIAGTQFTQSGVMLRILSISIFGTCFGMAFGHVALAINRQKESLWIYISDAIFSLIGYFIFIPRYGWLGAAGVTIFSEFYAGFLLMAQTIFYSKFCPRIWAFVKILLASTIMGTIIWKLQALNIIIVATLGAFIYTLAIFALRVVSVETLKSVMKIKNPRID